MSYKIETRYIYQCNFCKKKTVFKELKEGTLPNGWSEITVREWNDGTTRGNELLFASMCPACLKRMRECFYASDEFIDDERD